MRPDHRRVAGRSRSSGPSDDHGPSTVQHILHLAAIDRLVNDQNQSPAIAADHPSEAQAAPRPAMPSASIAHIAKRPSKSANPSGKPADECSGMMARLDVASGVQSQHPPPGSDHRSAAPHARCRSADARPTIAMTAFPPYCGAAFQAVSQIMIHRWRVGRRSFGRMGVAWCGFPSAAPRFRSYPSGNSSDTGGYGGSVPLLASKKVLPGAT
jgi:hypothetical protein